ncbi:SDR family oxidoreductase [Actinomycetes bacterium KLBMP 9797]
MYEPIAGRFTGRTVIVTGAASGIGLATAQRFWAEGASVVLAGRNGDALHTASTNLPGPRSTTHVVDVTHYDQVEQMIQHTIHTYGQLDILINNAGVATLGLATNSDLADWQHVMAVNASGVFHGCRAALPHLIHTHGNIVNTASVSGLRADWGMSIYDASKGAVVNLTRALALDHGKDGVRVNAVCPTVTRTAMTGPIEERTDVMNRLRNRIPLGRIAQPPDIAAAITFLASDDARFITGVNLPVDGGVTASNGQPMLDQPDGQPVLA